MTRQLTIYTDYKSPYAYLAKDLVYQLAEDERVRLDWLPYTLNIADYLGSATLGPQGEVLEEQRTPHQWRRVRYSYMDARRYASLRGLVIRGPRKIWDSSRANIGLLWVKRQGEGPLRRYQDRVFERFWKRELDIEDPAVIEAVAREAGADVSGLRNWMDGPGRAEHDRLRAEAEALGVFGVPTFVLDGELFWGREHLELIRMRLRAGAG
jgi:2-hydroxychromene-2-carboxylate isomerase